MADFILKTVHSFRSLWVALIVIALLSSPFINKAEGNASPIQIRVADTIAGLSTELDLESAKALSPVEVLLHKADGSDLSLEGISDAKGALSFTVSDYHLRTAGIYSVEARNLNSKENWSEKVSFQVHTGTVSESKSSVSTSKNTAQAGETLEVLVKLKDSYGNPIDGHTVQVFSSRNRDEVYSPDPLSDPQGTVRYFIKSSQKGISEISALDSSVNKILTERPKVAFLSGSQEFEEMGGFSNQYSAVILAEESGPIDSFRITGLEDGVEPGVNTSVSLTAIDENGLTVLDYTGTVHFSSTDDDATLPNDYTFTAGDQGEHTFSLGFKFVNEGEQSVTATDLDQSNISGESTFMVGEEAPSGTGQVEGDFTLVSPASGTYSENDIEVQGEAEYGYHAIIYMNEDEVGRTEVEFDNSFTFTVENMEDGDYELYVDIVELGEGEPGEEEILSVFETSDREMITIDTTAPTLVSVKVEPSGSLDAGSTATVTILTESDLEEVSVILNDELYELTETATSGKYEGEIAVPTTDGNYSMDIILMDSLGNEVQYRDELNLTVGEGSAEPTPEEPEDESPVSGEGAPGVISGLSALAGEEQVTLTWESATQGEDPIAHYTVHYGPSADALFAVSETFDSSTSWFIPSLQAGQTYYFAVSAVDVNGLEGEMSAVVSATPLAKAGTVAPTIPQPTTPVISKVGTPEETPDSGPVTNVLIGLSLAGATLWTLARRRKLAFASQENF